MLTSEDNPEESETIQEIINNINICDNIPENVNLSLQNFYLDKKHSETLIQKIGEIDINCIENEIKQNELFSTIDKCNVNQKNDQSNKNHIATFPYTYIQLSTDQHLIDLDHVLSKDLSEPYSIFTYRYFIKDNKDLSFLTYDQDKCIGVIMCKLDYTLFGKLRGYIGMIAVLKEYRRKGIARNLFLLSSNTMCKYKCCEIYLETEVKNKDALQFYQSLGFTRTKRLYRYYMNENDAFVMSRPLSKSTYFDTSCINLQITKCIY
ncbi:N-alpha-acetyltransferase 30 [Intoshia linei]|uniref:N-alpha-acetyltransferase 30 n=1 Tax=Intoshia linei TaxID=1819745 RepID=A0A177B8A2_9BILA|nr:N-alpha-acetyltransferase 30 [Intoshia linei]